MNFRKKLIRDFVYCLFIGIYKTFRQFPLWINLKLGSFFGIFCFYLLKKERKRSLEHLGLAFGTLGDRERMAIARKNFRRIGINIMENISMDKSLSIGSERIVVNGLEFIKAALVKGNGLIWVTGHIGNWEIMPAYFSSVLRYPVSVIAAPLYDERLTRIIVAWRESFGVRTILRGGLASYRQIRECFTKNRMLGILIDQDTKVPGVFVDFFGMKAFTPRGAMDLALRFKAPIVVGFPERIDKYEYNITISNFEIEGCADYEETVIKNTQKLTRIIEDEIRRRPEDWVWMHRRWKRKISKDKVSS